MIKSITDYTYEILNEINKPLHYKEITKLVLNRRNIKGITPHETLRSLIGNDSRFIRVARGAYALREWPNYRGIRYAKDIAYDILETSARPMGIEELGERIIQERYFVGGAKQVARNVIRTDKRVYYDETTKMVSLVNWK